jgi:hypothetical protein
VIGDLKEPESREWADDCANGIHQAFEAEGAAVGGRTNVGSEESFLGRRADTAAKPCGGAADQDVVGVRGESKRRGSQCGEGVTEDGQRFAALQAVGVMAGTEFCEARKAIGDSFDCAEPYGTRSNCGKKGRQNSGGDFVAPVAEQAGEADAQDGAREPMLFLIDAGGAHGKKV